MGGVVGVAGVQFRSARDRSDAHRHPGQRNAGSEMADFAIGVHSVGVIVAARRHGSLVLMLVIVMAKVLRITKPCFVRAIARSGSPHQLKRHQSKQKYDE